MLKGWVSEKIKDGEMIGWLLESESYTHRTAVVKIGEQQFETICNRVRTKPVKFPLHRNFGFRIKIPTDYLETLIPGTEIILKDKETGTIIHRTALHDSNSDSAYKENGIFGKITGYLKDNCITGFLASSQQKASETKSFQENARDTVIESNISENRHTVRIAILIIDGEKYECVANLKGTYRSNGGRIFKDAGFRIRLSPDRIALLPKNFNVSLSDLETGRIIEERYIKKPAEIIPANFDEYLRYSMISPVIYAPFEEVHKRCFAVMENISSYLAGKSDPNILLSVIMPVYNREGCVKEAIESVLAQTHRNLELVIINDGSTDKTKDIIRSFSDPRIVILETEKNSGCAFARNLGLANAKGDYIFYLDSDNLWDRRYLSVMLGAFIECKNPNAVYSGQYLFKKNLTNCMAVRFASFNPSLLENRNYIDLNCFAHRRDTVEKVGYFNTSLRRLVDAEFILRISRKCRICSIPVLLSIYRYGRADNTITETEKTPDVDFAEIQFQEGETNLTITDSSIKNCAHDNKQSVTQIRTTDNLSKCYDVHSQERGITLIIPNFEGFDVLRQCIESLLHSTLLPNEIIISDNGSSGDTVRNLVSFLEDLDKNTTAIHTRILRSGNSDNDSAVQNSEDLRDLSSHQADGIQITLILNNGNFGFTHAVNQGLSLAGKGNDVIIANNDALFHHDAVKALKKTASSSPNCGLAAPRQVIFAGNNAITSHVPFANPDRNCDINISAVYRNVEHVPIFCDGTNIEISYAPFFCIYIKREVLNRLPAMDEEHGRHYRSDRIFCDYIRKILGLRILYAADAVVYHHHQMSTEQLKKESPELYRTMYEQNAWSPEERKEFRFNEKIWQKEYDNRDREIWQIINSGYFDEKWYSEHYLTNSAEESQTSPSSFHRLGECAVINDNCSNADRNSNADTDGYSKSIQNPLEHYLTVGWKKGYKPSECFNNKTFYKNTEIRANSKTSDSAFMNPLSRYLKSICETGSNCRYSLPDTLDRETINRILADLAKLGGSSIDSSNMITVVIKLLSMQISCNDLKLINSSRLFNKKWYLKKYPDVSTGLLTPEQHYVFLGWTLGYDPSPLFSTSLYLDFNSDVEKAGMCPLLHYLKNGFSEKRKIYPAFSETAPSITDRLNRKFKKQDPLISIIVASYNYAGLISEALDSIQEQTYRNYEVIIIDDGSTDNSLEIIMPYLDNENFHLYNHENNVNKGLPDTIRLGLEKCKGDYVAFLEADDIWESNYLEEKVACIRKYADVKIIVNDLTLFGDKSDDEIRGIRKHIAGVYSRFASTRTYISPEEFRTQNWIFTFSCTMVKKEPLVQCDFSRNPVKANLDWWLWRQVCLDAPVYFINKKLTRWRLHDSYMDTARLSSRLNMEVFLSEGDRILIQRNSAKAGKLSEFTDPSITFQNGEILKNNVVLKKQPEFSVILPAYNSADCIKNAIDSLLNQQYRHFEIIITDDGSTDGTSQVIKDNYPEEISTGKIILVRTENRGVSHARNTAIAQANNPWIAYLDADNTATPVFLGAFAEQIIKNSVPHSHDKKAPQMFYGKIYCINKRYEIGGEFNYEKLQKENFIDLNAFCHSRELYQKLGGFDTSMKRLVDWDLILRYVKGSVPLYIPKTLVLYNDSEDSRRITISANLHDSFNYVRKKQNCYPTVTTVITAFNHENFISEAIESAVVQKGEFIHEILISDDGSDDHTGEIIKKYADSYPNLIKSISSAKGENMGISRNLKKCFKEATGDYIAILEGDDYWTDQSKLDRQLRFMKHNSDCSMVFNRINLLRDGKLVELPRQINLPEKLNGDNFIKEPTMNLIANFSCCFFKTSIMKSLPEILFKDRFNEIALAFYIEQKGKIGFIPKSMTVYRIHEHGIWSAANEKYKLESGLACRKTAYAVCRRKYRKAIEFIIKEKYERPLDAMALTEK
jgi:glycosyltransferase involved in cell wall biosynthesis